MSNALHNLPAATAVQVHPLPAASSGAETADKIKAYFTRVEGAITVFSILAGTAVALTWGVQLGLLVGAAGIILAMGIALCRSSESASPTEAAPQYPLPPDMLQQFPPDHRMNQQVPGTGQTWQGFFQGAYQQARREETEAEAKFRRKVRHVRDINIDHLQINQMNLPFAVPFEKMALIQFLCRCFLNIDFNQIALLEVDETFEWGSSGQDSAANGSICLCVMVPGVAITFTYEGNEYKIHATKEGIPDGLFLKNDVVPGQFPWKLIAINR